MPAARPRSAAALLLIAAGASPALADAISITAVKAAQERTAGGAAIAKQGGLATGTVCAAGGGDACPVAASYLCGQIGDTPDQENPFAIRHFSLLYAWVVDTAALTGALDVEPLDLTDTAAFGSGLDGGYAESRVAAPHRGLFWPMRDRLENPPPPDAPVHAHTEEVHVLPDGVYRIKDVTGGSRGGPTEPSSFYSRSPDLLRRGIPGDGFPDHMTLYGFTVRATAGPQRLVKVFVADSAQSPTNPAGVATIVTFNPTRFNSPGTPVDERYRETQVPIPSTAASPLWLVVPSTSDPADGRWVNGLCAIDQGEYDPEPYAVQTTQTDGVDNNLSDPALASGSELDALYAKIVCQDGDGAGCDARLRVFLAGNLASDGSRVVLFIDSIPGQGQERLLGVHPAAPGSGLNRMAEKTPTNGNPTGGPNGPGLTFDPGFAPDYAVHVQLTNPGTASLDVFHAELLTGGGGRGWYCGNITADQFLTGNGNLQFASSGAPPIRASINNINPYGVARGIGAAPASGPGSSRDVYTGLELDIPLAAIGNPGAGVRLCAMIVNPAFSAVSNQVLPGVGPRGNLGEPRAVNFADIPGAQMVEVRHLHAPPTRYRLFDLGNLGGTIAQAEAISDGGEDLGGPGALYVVGTSATSGGTHRGFRWQRPSTGPATMTAILTGGPVATALAVADNGIAAGFIIQPSNLPAAAYRAHSGGQVLLGDTIPALADRSMATGVSASSPISSTPSMIVGTYDFSELQSRAFRWTSSPCFGQVTGPCFMTLSPPQPATEAAARGLNSNGVIVGSSWRLSGSNITAKWATVWQGFTAEHFGSGQDFCEAVAVSSPPSPHHGREWIVGHKRSTLGPGGTPFDGGAETQHAFVLRRLNNAASGPRTLIDLGRLPGDQQSQASDANHNTSDPSRHGVVGSSRDAALQPRAVLWPRSGGIIDLNTLTIACAGANLDWTLQAAAGIDNAGRIVGYGTRAGSTGRHAFLLEPIPGCPADFNLSGQVTVQDIFDFLAAYFTSSARSDVNCSGAVSIQDVFDMLSDYFRPCD